MLKGYYTGVVLHFHKGTQKGQMKKQKEWSKLKQQMSDYPDFKYLVWVKLNAGSYISLNA